MTDVAETAVLEISVTGSVLVLTLNRPQARNALSPALVTALNGVLDRFIADDGLGAAVVTGNGPAFCAGLDLKVYSAPDADRRAPATLIRRFGSLPKPVIGAVNGPCMTGALELALGCDWLVGSPAAMFADTHVMIGAFPGGGMTARLSRAVGLRTAKAMSLGGVRLTAEQALHAGLLAEIVDPERLVEHTVEQAHRVASADPELVRLVRGLYEGNADRSLPDGLAAEQEELQRWRAMGPGQWRALPTDKREHSR
jgi:enoyl-CoA hydratase